MQIYKKKFFFITLVILSIASLLLLIYQPLNSWLYQKRLLSYRESPAPYSPYSLKFFKEYLNFIEKKHGFYCDGTGGRFGEKISLISLSFLGVGNHSIEESRSLYLDCTEELLQRLNNDPNLRPYLEPYPFTPKNIEFMIGFRTKEKNWTPKEFITLVFVAKGTIFYNSMNPRTDKFIDRYEEPYEEGLSLVKDQLPLPRTTLSFTEKLKSVYFNKS